MIITLLLTDKHCEISVERESVAFTVREYLLCIFQSLICDYLS